MNVKKRYATISQENFFRLCNYLQNHTDLKTSSNDTIKSLLKLELSDVTLTDTILDRARKLLGNGWVLQKPAKPRAAYGSKTKKTKVNAMDTARILTAILGLYTHFEVPIPPGLIDTTQPMDDAT